MDMSIDRRGFLRDGGALVASVAAAGLWSDLLRAGHHHRVPGSGSGELSLGDGRGRRCLGAASHHPPEHRVPPLR